MCKEFDDIVNGSLVCVGLLEEVESCLNEFGIGLFGG